MQDKTVIYSEVFEILKNIDKKMVMKIPEEILENIKNNKDTNYKEHIDWNKKLSEQNLQEETINIIGFIYYNYWCDSSKEKDNFRNIVLSNKYNIKNKNVESNLIIPNDKLTISEKILRKIF